MAIINRVAELSDQVADWRRELHRNPELGYQETRTAGFVADKLRAFGVDEVHAGIGVTGVVGVLRGQGSGPSIGLRADMDALPIHERSGAPHASRNAGVMHACGHDGHTAMLLGAARYLAETRNFAGTVHLIFQPAEEGLAGAKRMMQDGLFERFPTERVFGMHNWPWMPVGEFGMCDGAAMAAADRIEITLTGVGCHAAMPHTGKDPIVAAALLVQAIQGIVSRETDALDNAVVSITKVAGGDAFNVVPDEVQLAGTVRTYRKETQERIRHRLEQVVQGIAAAQGIAGKLVYIHGYPATFNAAAEARLGVEVAAQVAGDDRVTLGVAPSMGAEDFAFMLEERPGSYIWLGSGGAEEGRILHSASYDFNDAAIPYGVSYWARLVEHTLPR